MVVGIVNYNFDETGIGTMDPNNTKIYVRTDCEEAHYRTLTINHENYISARFMDVEAGNMICHDHQGSVRAYIERWRNGCPTQRSYIMTYNIPSPLREQRSRNYLHPKCRYLVKQMLKFVVDQHLQGYSLKNFTLNDLAMVGDILKFSCVGFHQPSTRETRMQDFNCIFRIMEELFGPFRSYPPDLQDLCLKMRNYRFLMPSDGLLLVYHLSIMSPTEAVSFMRNCSEKQSSLPRHKKEDYKQAIIRMTNCPEWNNLFRDPRLHYMEQCINAGDYTFSGRPIEVKRSMIRSWRNIVAHLNGHAPRGTSFDELSIQLMIMEVLGHKVLEFQEKLFQLGLLALFL